MCVRNDLDNGIVFWLGRQRKFLVFMLIPLSDGECHVRPAHGIVIRSGITGVALSMTSVRKNKNTYN